MRSRRYARMAGMSLLLAMMGVAAQADDRAEALLRLTRAATAKLQTLRADVDIPTKNVTGTLMLKRPNLAYFKLKGSFEWLTVSNGEHVFTYSPPQNQYEKGDPGPEGDKIFIPFRETANGFLASSFFRPDSIGRVTGGGSPAYRGKRKLGNVECDVIEFDLPPPVSVRARYFISAEDHLIHQGIVTLKEGDRTFRTMFRLKNVRINSPIAASVFQWTPPPMARVTPTPEDLERALIPVGQVAPDFNLPMPRGGQFSLSAARKRSKAVLLNFWFFG
jgi:outer membrane lipoprotein-sorting protein